jgi:putative transposase
VYEELKQRILLQVKILPDQQPTRVRHMTNNNIVALNTPAQDVLSELLKTGAQQLLTQAIEAEVATLIAQHRGLMTESGLQGIVRNGYLPERTVQTGLGDIDVKIPKVRDRTGQGIKFNSGLVPPYLKRAKTIEELLPWLYLKGISTGDFKDALAGLLGANAKGLSSNTISRLKQTWEGEYGQWRKRDLSKRRYVYIWADGVYCNVRQDDKLCLLVIMGSDSTGRKEVIGLTDGYRESEASWLELLEQLCEQGVTVPPEVAVGDGALGFWKDITKHWPATMHQRCWVHNTANVLNKVPKAMQPKVKENLHDIWMSDSRANAEKAFDLCVRKYEAKSPKAMHCLQKDRDKMLTFYDFLAEHWAHIRTSNPIESVFATVRLRTTKPKNCGFRVMTLAMAFKLMYSNPNYGAF